MKRHKSLNPTPLIEISRGNILENIHSGWICVLNKNKKVVYKKGNISDYAFLRSIAKPIQAIETLNSRVKTTPKELAIICGSHTGSSKHLDILKTFIKKNDLNIRDLRCGTHPPSDEAERKNLILKGESPIVLHNNCSGKHLGMLSVCKKNHYSLKDYLNPSHPLQESILNSIKELSETKDILIATDGCSLPTFALPIINIGFLFSNFTLDKKYKKITEAMSLNPFYTGGKNQIDTEIMTISKGKLISKVGADGILMVSYDGNSLIIKIADGSPKIRSFVVLKTLVQLGWLKEIEIENSVLKNIYSGDIKNIAGKTVGKLSLQAN